MRYVNARAIAQKALIEEIIPEAVEKQINESKSSDAAKNVLFEHLQNQVMLEGLRCFCSIMIESKGYQQMQKFGKELLAKPEEVRWDCTSWFRVNRQFSLANYILTNTLIITSYNLCYLLVHQWILLLY